MSSSDSDDDYSTRAVFGTPSNRRVSNPPSSPPVGQNNNNPLSRAPSARLSLPWPNHQHRSAARSHRRHTTTDDLNYYSGDVDEWRFEPTNNNNNAPPPPPAPQSLCSSTANLSLDPAAHPTAASQQPPRPGIMQSAGSASPGDMLTAPPPDSSSATSPRSSAPAAAAPPAAAAVPSPQVVTSGQQHVGGSPSQSPPPAAAAVAESHEPSHLPEGFNHAIAYVNTVKMRFREDLEVYDKFLVTLKAFQSGQRRIEEVLDEVLVLFADHADLLRGFSDFFPDNLQSQAKAQLGFAVAEAEERANAQEANAPSPMLASSPSAALLGDFAPSPISLPSAARGVMSNTTRGDQQGCIGDAQNKSAIGVAELGMGLEEESDNSNDEGTHDDVAKVLFEEEAEEMSDENKEDADNSPVICDVCQDLTVFNRTADTLGIGGTWCCESCNVDTFLLSQTTDGSVASVASSHLSIRNRSPTFDTLYAKNYKMVRRNKSRGFSTGYDGKYKRVYTKQFGSAQAARLATQCLILARESIIDVDGNISWKGVSDYLVQPLHEWMFELRSDVVSMRNISGAAKHFIKPDLKGDDNDVVVTALKALATYLEEGPNNKKWECNRTILNKIAKELVRIAENIDAEDESSLEFPWVGVAATKSYQLPTEEDWRKESEKLSRQLEGKKKENTKSILRRLEAVAFFFASQKTTFGHYGPPTSVTNAQLDPRHHVMAEYSIVVLFKGLLCDPLCADKDFRHYIPVEFRDDPFQMPMKKKKEVLLHFLRKSGVIEDWYTPFCLRDWSVDNYNQDAYDAEVEKMKGVFESRIGRESNLARLRNEKSQMDAKEDLQDEHVRRCEEDGKSLLSLIDKYNNQSSTVSLSLDVFKKKFTRELQKIDGLEDFSADHFPSLRNTDDSVWQNKKNRSQRGGVLSQLTHQVITALYPSNINGRKPGDCTHPNCCRNLFEMNGTSFQGCHVDATMKTDQPSKLIQIDGSAGLIGEMKLAGIRPSCALHHDAWEGRRKNELDVKNHHLLSPPQTALERDDGKDFFGMLQDNRVLRLQYCLFIMDCYGRGFLTQSFAGIHMGDYNTLRVMYLAYFDTVADDVVSLSATQWNDINNTSVPIHYIRTSLRYTAQIHCGVCPAANEPGTSFAENNSRDQWEDSDYACRKENYDFRKYALVERQRIEGDHTKAQSTTDNSRHVSNQGNLFAMLDEIYHAPYHCYFCHKLRTANQYRENSWHTTERKFV